MTKHDKALEIMHRLYKATPHPEVELHFSTPFELLVATMLAAQCTDKLVNTVTPALFFKYKTIK
ncbi:MAG: endonuclease III, partial [Patescibacteria group bacterium]